MRIPWIIFALGLAGLLPFAVDPLWVLLSPGTVPVWLDRAWLMYVALIAGFLAGSFWGFSLMAAMGPEGKVGLLLSAILLGMTWVSLMLPFDAALYTLCANFVMLWAADIWRERTLGDIPGYFALRSALTAAALLVLLGRIYAA